MRPEIQGAIVNIIKRFQLLMTTWPTSEIKNKFPLKKSSLTMRLTAVISIINNNNNNNNNKNKNKHFYCGRLRIVYHV